MRRREKLRRSDFHGATEIRQQRSTITTEVLNGTSLRYVTITNQRQPAASSGGFHENNSSNTNDSNRTRSEHTHHHVAQGALPSPPPSAKAPSCSQHSSIFAAAEKISPDGFSPIPTVPYHAGFEYRGIVLLPADQSSSLKSNHRLSNIASHETNRLRRNRGVSSVTCRLPCDGRCGIETILSSRAFGSVKQANMALHYILWGGKLPVYPLPHPLRTKPDTQRHDQVTPTESSTLPDPFRPPTEEGLEFHIAWLSNSSLFVVLPVRGESQAWSPPPSEVASPSSPAPPARRSFPPSGRPRCHSPAAPGRGGIRPGDFFWGSSSAMRQQPRRIRSQERSSR